MLKYSEMEMCTTSSNWVVLRQRARRNRRAMTLVETIVALALLVVSGVAGVYSFMLLNRYAMRERNISSAKALCQERIDQALTTTFRPTAVPQSVPAVLGQDGAYYSILGTLVPPIPPSTSPPTYNGTNTCTEPVTVYVQQDGSTNSSVAGTRVTTATPAPFTNGVGVSLGIEQFTVTVTYTFNGESRTYSMYTMRSPD